MSLSGKTAAPFEIPYYLGTDKPPDLAAGTKTPAERIHKLLEEIAPKQITGVAKKQLLIANASGVVTAVTASGDVTNDESGVFSIGPEKVDAARIKKETITLEKLAKALGLTDSYLASPNNLAYRTMLATSSVIPEASSGTRYLVPGGNVTSGAASAALLALYFAKADYEVAGKTQKLRLRAQEFTAATGPGVTLTVGLYSITGIAAGTLTVGAVIAGSTVAFASTAANTRAQGNSGDFAIPEDGYYMLGVANSGTTAANSAHVLNVQLQTRSI